ncbi:hypothetical protein SMD11_0914 [Streptomyces albireticuli]|uniref:Uncharacterized protein n=1 Tax=Streptomyces albireticuli TaxID=1940 RepID=A0A1Z2KX22_9ACTN|nr:hypothetical protein SMD11_0914 [Streptomyces albireticuli]
MAEDGLVRADEQGPVRGAPGAVDLGERAEFDHVAEGRAGAMRLDVVDVVRGEPGGGEGVADDGFLRGGVGRGEAEAAAVVVHGRAADDGVDPVVVGEGVGEPFEDDDAAALAAHDAVGGGVEGPAPAGGRDRPDGAHEDADLRP